MSNKSKGINFERTIKHKLEENGFFVIRQSASKFPDLVAFKKSKFYGSNGGIVNLYFIECKVAKNFSKKEKIGLLGLSSRFGGHPILAYKENKEIKLYDLKTGLFVRLE